MTTNSGVFRYGALAAGAAVLALVGSVVFDIVSQSLKAPGVLQPGPPVPVAPVVVADPFDGPLEPTNPKPGPFPDDFRAAVFPATPSPFILVLDRAQRKAESFDGRTLQRLGDRYQVAHPFVPVVFSPDGKREAILYDIFVSENTFANPEGGIGFTRKSNRVTMPFAYARPGRLIVADGDDLVVHENHATRQFRLEKLPWRDAGQACAISAAGRYLAIFDDRMKIVVYDLDNGNPTAHLTVPFAAGVDDSLQCQGVAFSHDGTKLACSLSRLDESKLFIWTMHPQKLEKTIPCARVAVENLRVGEGLEWTSDGKALLLGSRVLIDVEHEVPLWTAPANNGNAPARLIGSWHLLVSGPTPTHFELPRQQITELREDLAARKPNPRHAVKLPDAPAEPKWPGLVDAAPPSTVRLNSMMLQEMAAAVTGIYSNNVGDPRSAVLARDLKGEVDAKSPLFLSTYAMRTGRKTAGPIKVCEGTKSDWIVGNLAADLDPRGQLLAVVDPVSKQRLDLWTLNGEHLEAWTPFK